MKDLPSPRQLRYLIALSETLHFGRAASMCAVTQSTLSAGLKELEATLGVTLVERTKRSVVVTALGRVIAARARETVQALEDLVDLAQSGRGQLMGPLNLGVIPTIAPYLLPALLTATRKQFPKLKIFVREEQTASVLARLHEGALDVALIALPYDTDSLTVDEIGAEDVVICLPTDHPLAKKKSIAAADLKDVPLLLLEDGHCLRDHALAACRLTTKRANEVYQATSLATLVQMVRGGLGVTMLPRMAAPIETSGQSGIVIRPLERETTARQIALVWRVSAVKGPEFHKLAGVFRNVFKAHVRQAQKA
ncbi:MAG: hydrogen peroxide-inducible genes activator [Rhodospirillaceae bacterium]|nr:hydrogen peroxide-inducible genes activator [Rhodospirillaceae bacterium]